MTSSIDAWHARFGLWLARSHQAVADNYGVSLSTRWLRQFTGAHPGNA